MPEIALDPISPEECEGAAPQEAQAEPPVEAQEEAQREEEEQQDSEQEGEGEEGTAGGKKKKKKKKKNKKKKPEEPLEEEKAPQAPQTQTRPPAASASRAAAAPVAPKPNAAQRKLEEQMAKEMFEQLSRRSKEEEDALIASLTGTENTSLLERFLKVHRANANLEAQIKEQKQLIEPTKDALGEAQGRLAKETSRMDAMQKLCDQLAQECKDLEAKDAEMTKMDKEEREKIHHSAQSRLDVVNSKMEELKSEECESAKVWRCNQDLLQRKARATEMREKLETLKKEREEEVAKKKEEFTASLEKHSATKAAKEAELEEMKAEIAKENEAIAPLSAQAKECSEQVGDFHRSMDRWTGEVAKHKEFMARSQKQIKALNHDQAILKRKAEKASYAHREAVAAENTQNRKRGEMEAHIAALQEALSGKRDTACTEDATVVA